MVIAGLARRAEAHSAKAGPGNPSGAATQKTVLTSLLRLIMDARVPPSLAFRELWRGKQARA